MNTDVSADDCSNEAVSLLRRRAMDLLAVREHSRKELRGKLLARLDQTDRLDDVLDWLEDEGLLSDQRFAEAFVRSRIGRGQGPVRIRQELIQRGVPEGLACQAIDTEGCDWFELAAQVAGRRFGSEPASERRELARRLRFLQYRGFTTEQCREALGM